jgi:hypothetical protein
MQTIKGVTQEQLNEYNPEAFDAYKQPDGTYDLVPVRWMNQEEYDNVQYGCGEESEQIDSD